MPYKAILVWLYGCGYAEICGWVSSSIHIPSSAVSPVTIVRCARELRDLIYVVVVVIGIPNDRSIDRNLIVRLVLCHDREML